jgi:uncharacterized protein
MAPRETLGEIVVDGRARSIDIDRGSARFEIRVDDQVAVLIFHVRSSTLSLIHTDVPPGLRGRGLAEALARTALTYARNQGWTVKPYCPFVAEYIRRHPEYQSLVAPDFPVTSEPQQAMETRKHKEKGR